MIYMLNFLSQGFTLKESFELYKFKLKTFNPKTYYVLKIICTWLIIQKEKFCNFIDKYRK